MFGKLITFEEVGKLQGISLSFLFSLLFVGSLYVWPDKHNRDHPQTIKNRTIRITIASILSCCLLYFSASPSLNDKSGQTLFKYIGIRSTSLPQAVLCPSLLLFLLFLGPIFNLLVDGDFSTYLVGQIDFKDIKVVRNLVIAPFFEELVFRGCMIPLLYPSFSNWSMLLAPLFFGIAHIHHAYALYLSQTCRVSDIILMTIFQTFYTTIFGVLSSFIFIRTNHLLAVCISHSFCNLMGFPDLESVFSHKYKIPICFMYCLGLVLFLYTLYPLTNPLIF